jgi:Spy/CpxP family protein refolding chaperone
MVLSTDGRLAMRTVRTAMMVALALAMACSVFAAEKKKGEKKAPSSPTAQKIERLIEGLTLTDEQKAKLADVAKEMGPKYEPLTKKMNEVLTPEQQKAQSEAVKAAKEAGKKGRELYEAGAAAAKPTDEQKAKQIEVRKEMVPLDKELQEKVLAVLTAEQKQQVEKKLAAGKKKAAK